MVTELLSDDLFLSVLGFALIVETNNIESFFIFFLYNLLTGTVRRFLEKFADIELVVFAVENADEVMVYGD